MTVAEIEQTYIESLGLSPSRQAVLDIVAKAGKPMKAYDILSELQKVISHAKPPTVYRALEYLVSVNILHRINQQNAYMYCQAEKKCYLDKSNRYSMLFTCMKCGSVEEVSNNVLTSVVTEMATKISFQVDLKFVECPGACRSCQQESATA